jgi:pseudouridine-5'-phosphate glycosidase
MTEGTRPVDEVMDIAPEVAAALAEGSAVVALESTVIAHGLPAPQNLETACRLEALVRAGGALPATVAVVEGRLKVGLCAADLERLALSGEALKVGCGDLAAALAGRRLGATTVSATLVAAARAGIRLFATGGIGGVHRGAMGSDDVSADLHALAREPVAVVAAGAKSILDLPRTLERLESLGVPVVGYRTARFPAFHVTDSGLALGQRVDDVVAAARLLVGHWTLGLRGVVIAQAVPPEAALDGQEVEAWVATAERMAETRGIAGKALTPFLLARLAELSGGRTLDANLALLEANAQLAAQIAAAYAAASRGQV